MSGNYAGVLRVLRYVRDNPSCKQVDAAVWSGSQTESVALEIEHAESLPPGQARRSARAFARKRARDAASSSIVLCRRRRWVREFVERGSKLMRLQLTESGRVFLTHMEGGGDTAPDC